MRAARSKLIALAISAVLALVATKVVIAHYGLTAYAIFALILSIPALLPSRDLGLGAEVIDVVARRAELGREALEETLAAALGRISQIAAVSVLLLVALQVTVGWAAFLGGAVKGVPESAISVTLVLFALSLPGGLGASVLWGLRRLDLLAWQGPVLTFATCASVVAAALLGLPLWVALVLSMGFNFVVQWITLALVTRHLHLSWAHLGGRAIRPVSRAFRGWALPMLVISTAGSLAYQTDRVVLSHVKGALAVAQYSVVAQMFFPLLGILSSAGYTLWAKYAVQRGTHGVSRSSFWRTTAIFAGFGVVEGVFLLLVGPPAIQSLLGVDVGVGLCAAFGVLLVLQSTGFPVGMLMTDRRGLRQQALLFSIMVVLNVCLSIVLAAKLGTSGPVLASAATYLGVVLLPSVACARRYLTAAT